MTTEYHDDDTSDNQAFWNQGSPSKLVMFQSRWNWKEYLFPVVTSVLLLALIIALGVSNTQSENRFSSVEKSVINLTTSVQNVLSSLSLVHDKAEEAAKEIHRLQFATESIQDQLDSVSEVARGFTVVESLSRTVAGIKCSLDRIINNSTTFGAGCCPLDWELYRDRCYFFSRNILAWDSARDWCSNHGAHLTILTTDQEWTFVTSHTMPQFYWVGLTDERTGKWEWVNQSPYTVERRRWVPGQPDNWEEHGMGGTEDCAHLHSNGRLNDLHCSTPLRYVCQQHSMTM